MKILGLYTSMPSSVSLFDGQKVVAATHEERFTRKKGDEVFPRSSIDYCLKESGIRPADLDGVAIASLISPIDNQLVRWSQWSVDD